MSDRLLRILAALAAVVSAMAAVAAGVLYTGREPQPLEVVGGVAAVAWSICGALLVRARPRNWVGWLLLLVGTTQAVGPFAAVLGVRLLDQDPASELGLVAAWMGSFYWPIGILVPVTVLLVLYPTGRLPSARWRPVLICSIAGISLMCFALATSPGALDDVVPGARLPFGRPPWTDAVAAVVLLGLLVPSVLITVGGTALRLRRAGQPERQQLSWLILPVAALVVFSFIDVLGHWGIVLAFVTVPLAVVVGVLRYNLLGIEVVVRRTLVYVLLTAAVAVVFALVTTALSRLLPPGPAPTFVAAALVAVGLVPARDVLHRTVDHVVYGERRDPIAVMGRLGRQVVDQDPADLMPGMLAALTVALRVPSVMVLGGAGDLVVSYGDPPAGGGETSVRLRYAAGEIGRLVVVTAPGDALSGADRRLLDAVAPMMAAVLRAAALAADLEQARQRAVGVALAERDRLRRDLHDGLGPSLTGMSLGLEAVEAALARDPAAARDIVERLRQEMRSAIGEIRRILAGLRPGVLEQRGLADALRQRARAAADTGDLAVAVTIPNPLPPLPGEIEVAAYRIADEALTNVVRHAAARNATVTLTVTDAVHLEICDDGHGFPAEPANGVGLASMRHRTDEFGGELVVTSSPTGTRIVASLPTEAR